MAYETVSFGGNSGEIRFNENMEFRFEAGRDGEICGWIQVEYEMLMVTYGYYRTKCPIEAAKRAVIAAREDALNKGDATAYNRFDAILKGF